MIITIHQPEHLPWIGFFNKMSMADVYVILDDVQYEKSNYQSRNRIMGTNGPQWINVPVKSKGALNTLIKDIEIAEQTNPNWRKKYLNTLYLSYRKYPYFDKHFAFFEELLKGSTKRLYDINEKIIFYFADILNIHPQFVRSSELTKEGKKSDLVLSICKTLEAQTYISGAGGRHYMDLGKFEEAGIDVIFQEYEHPVYMQHTNHNFEPYLSVLDLLMNVSDEEARDIVYCSRFSK